MNRKMFLCLAVLGMSSCYSYEPYERQEILLSYPELSSMTVGQTHPFIVGLNLPAEGTEILTASSDSDCVRLWSESYLLSKGETTKIFNITAVKPGEATVLFSLGKLLSKAMPVIRVYPQPETY